jgi:hypothetical protein
LTHAVGLRFILGSLVSSTKKKKNWPSQYNWNIAKSGIKQE